ncbi:26 kDa secreted antigen [Eurytemora carolleeae]|uniref:26 kDa secreted antigen n=1 Tax=Eurytemora carolleeae TaxID=1294199 RepID=UPI000C773235|nr:26 kDa secreted antigen [Eurytemora carolleeae]|eukprot:XP_023321523.1 26 kDa secreted antigen-like [Eurytemora affinis]
MRVERYLRFLLLPFTLPGSFGAGLEGAREMQMNKRNQDTAQSSRTPRQEFPSDTNSINGLPDETNEDWKSIWIRTGTVPNSIRDMPDHRLFVRFSNGIQIRPNDTVTTGLMLTPPELLWRTEPGSLYTILLVNTDIEDSLQGGRRSPGRKFVNWMISNVPLLDLDAGNVVFPYIPRRDRVVLAR